MRIKADFFWAIGACLALPGVDIALAQEDPLHIVAAAVRDTGHECQEPKSAMPDPKDTSVNEKTWIIDCGNATYRVKFVGDTAVDVSVVDS